VHVKKVVVLLTIVSFLFLSGQSLAQGQKNLLSASVGTFSPNDDDLENWNDGSAVDFSYVNSFSRNLAWMFNLAITNTDYDGATYEEELTTVGGEMLLLLQSTQNEFQPFIGGGIGIYSNAYEYTESDGSTYQDSGSAVGFVGILGARYFITQKVFIKGQGKIYSNYQEVNYYYGTKTYNFGGRVLQAGLGFRF
jgi:hypothetical protein